jgi:hypothetical protein
MIYVLLFGLLVYLTYTISSIKVYNQYKPSYPPSIDDQVKPKLKFPPSISETFYFMPHWAFVGFLMICMGCVMTISYMYMDAVGSLELFSVTNVGALILAGVPAFANMHYKKVRPLHLICAFLGFTIIGLGFGFDYNMWYWFITMIIVAVSTVIVTRKSNPVWWVEHALVISMLTGYGILSLTI